MSPAAMEGANQVNRAMPKVQASMTREFGRSAFVNLNWVSNGKIILITDERTMTLMPMPAIPFRPISAKKAVFCQGPNARSTSEGAMIR